MINTETQKFTGRSVSYKLSKIALTERHIHAQQRDDKEENGGENKIFTDSNIIEREVNNDHLATVKTAAMDFQQYSCFCLIEHCSDV